MDSQGLLLCARYSSAPNFFGYCGPPKNSTLVDHLREDIGDREVENILSQFDTLFLNLRLIAHENKIKEPFDQRVVEAYWIGNSLLKNVKSKNYTAMLGEKFELEKKIGRDKFGKLQYKFMSNQTLPHHSFHVFNIFKRTGNFSSNHTIETMDSCRVGFGQIISVGENQKSKIKDKNHSLKFKNVFVKSKQLIAKNQQLSLGKPTIKKLQLDYKGNVFLKDLKVGDWVSFHWGFVCDVLTNRQVRNLEFYTNKAIDFYNL